MPHKIWIIARREFWSRVRSKGFVFATLLGPLLMAAIIAVPILVITLFEDDAAKTLAVVDETGVLAARLALPDAYTLLDEALPPDSLRARVQAGRLSGYLVLPAGLLDGTGEAGYYSGGSGGLLFQEQLRGAVNEAVRQERLVRAGAPDAVLEILDERVRVSMVRVTEAGEEADATPILTGIGYAMGFLIYMCMFIYGSIVMRGVIEEKVSRIMEIVVSSARPFQLMMGKVLGIGAMGLLQLLVWSGLALALLTFGGSLTLLFLSPDQFGLPDEATQQELLAAANLTIPDVPASVFVYFMLFFLGGYLLYASLFAAVGSAVDQESDAQQLMLPVMLPIIIPILFINLVAVSPDSTLSTVLSIIPLFSPILMVVRTAITEVPFWQIALALVLLTGTFLGAIWVGARIYRTGILMYGKRPSFRDLARWMRYS